MRHDIRALEHAAGDTAGGTARDISDLDNVAVFVHKASAFAVTWKLQGKASGSVDPNDDWIDIASGGITNANAMIQVPNGFTHLRVFRTSTADADVKVSVSGKYNRGMP